jgi:hypothetical protein
MTKHRNTTILLTLITLLILVGRPSPVVLASTAASAPSLGTAANFVALAGTTMTNTGHGVYVGDVGTSPGSSVVGFPPGIMRHGTIYMGGAVPLQAQIDATNAYNVLALEGCDHNLTGQDLGGMILIPGVYCFNSSAGLTGTLVLDAVGDSLAVWVFQTVSSLTSASSSTVSVINGGQAINVYWKIGSSATLGTLTRFSGNILAQESISLATGASLTGRALALTGAVTMDTEDSPYPIANTPLFYIYFFPTIDKP